MAARDIATIDAQADALNIHRSMLYRLRAGTTNVSLGLAFDIADAAGVDVTKLFDRVKADRAVQVAA